MNPSSTRIDSDEPSEVDELGRQQLVEMLARIASTAETPLVMAIYGPWGSGKTSVLRQLRRTLDPDHEGGSQGDQRARTVWFDPWMFQFDDTPALGLLHAAVAQLDLRDQTNVRHALSSLVLALAVDIEIPFIGVRVGKLLKVREELARDDFNRREQREQMRDNFRLVLNTALEKGPERVVFLIDDLDRCRPQNAIALLEALKLYMDVPGCVYVLAVDRQPLEAAVAAEQSSLGVQAEKYLDKIIQLPFSLPAIDPTTLTSFIERRLPNDLHALVPVLASAAADEPRSVKRMINAILVAHELAQGVFQPERYAPTVLATIVLIQNELPDLYRQIRIDHRLLVDLFESRDIEGEEGADGLWATYIRPGSRLDRALSLVSIPSDVELTPYLTLSAVAPTPSRTVHEVASRTVYLSYRNADRLWARRVESSLESAGWSVLQDQTDLATGLPNRAFIKRDLASSVTCLALVGTGWVKRARALTDPGDRIRTELEVAEEIGVPVLPILAGVKALPRGLPSALNLSDRNFISIDESRYERSIVEIDRFLSEVAQVPSSPGSAL